MCKRKAVTVQSDIPLGRKSRRVNSTYEYDHFRKILAGRYIVDFVNKTLSDKGESARKQKTETCNGIEP